MADYGAERSRGLRLWRFEGVAKLSERERREQISFFFFFLNNNNNNNNNNSFFSDNKYF